MLRIVEGFAVNDFIISESYSKKGVRYNTRNQPKPPATTQNYPKPLTTIQNFSLIFNTVKEFRESSINC